MSGCKGSQEKKPQTQSTTQVPGARPERKTIPIPEKDAQAVRETAEAFLAAFVVQDFNKMWEIAAPISKDRTPLPDFIKLVDYRRAGTVLSTKVASVEGLEKDKALVKMVVNFQYFPSVFGIEDPQIMDLEWTDEWVRLGDGKWYRILPWRSPEQIAAEADLCSQEMLNRN